MSTLYNPAYRGALIITAIDSIGVAAVTNIDCREDSTGAERGTPLLPTILRMTICASSFFSRPRTRSWTSVRDSGASTSSRTLILIKLAEIGGDNTPGFSNKAPLVFYNPWGFNRVP